MCAGSPGLIAGPQIESAWRSSWPFGEITSPLNRKPLVFIGKVVREYTSRVSNSRMISRRVCEEIRGAFGGIGSNTGEGV